MNSMYLWIGIAIAPVLFSIIILCCVKRGVFDKR